MAFKGWTAVLLMAVIVTGCSKFQAVDDLASTGNGTYNIASGFLVPTVELKAAYSPAGDEFSVQATVKNYNREVTIRFYADGVKINDATEAPYCLFGQTADKKACRMDKLATPGKHVIRAEIIAPFSAQPPAAEITINQAAPAGPKVTLAVLGQPATGDFSVRATVTGATGNPTVRFYVDNVERFIALNEPYCLFGATAGQCVLNRFATDGRKAIRAEAYEGANKIAMAQISVTQGMTPPSGVRHLELKFTGVPTSFSVTAHATKPGSKVTYMKEDRTVLREETEKPYCLFGKNGMYCKHAKLATDGHHKILAEETDQNGNLLAMGHIELDQGGIHCVLQPEPNEVEVGEIGVLRWHSTLYYNLTERRITGIGEVSSRGAEFIAGPENRVFRGSFTANGAQRTCRNSIQVSGVGPGSREVHRYTHARNEDIVLQANSRYKVRLWGAGGRNCSYKCQLNPGGGDTTLEIPGRPRMVAGGGGDGTAGKNGIGGTASGGDINIAGKAPGAPVKRTIIGGEAGGLGGFGNQFPGGGDNGSMYNGVIHHGAGGGAGYVEAEIATGPTAVTATLTVGRRTGNMYTSTSTGLAEIEMITPVASEYKECKVAGQSFAHGSEFKVYFKNTVGRTEACDDPTNSEVRRCNHGFITRHVHREQVFLTCRKRLDCTGPDGRLIRDGEYWYYYKEAKPADTAYCISEKRTCTDGALSGTFTSPTCTEPPKDPPPDGGGP